MRLHTFATIIIATILSATAATAQQAARPAAVRLSGVVRDSLTREPIPYATVMVTGTDRGTLTDDDGRYSLATSLACDSVQAGVMGYESKTLPVSRKGQGQVRLDFDLRSTGLQLGTLVAKPRREHYSKKNNPAVEFMQRIRAARDLGDPRRREHYNYAKYERISLALNNYQFNDSARSGLDRKFAFFKEYIDTSALTGVPILNVAVREKSSTVHHRLHPRPAETEYVKGLRNAGLDEILDPASTQLFYEDVMREIDVYGDDVPMLQVRFVSPLSRIAPDFYKFYLTDTVALDSVQCAELTFVPRNPSTMGFTGRFYVPLQDSTMFIKKIIMRVPHDINLNWVNGLLITQEFERLPDGTRLKVKDDMVMEASLLPGMPGMYARRNTVYTAHDFGPAPDPHIFADGSAQVYAPGADDRNAAFWDTHRAAPISKGERSMEEMMARLRAVPVYYWAEKIIKIFTSGYVATGHPSYFDYGPVSSSVSYNKVEGLRLRAGGMTTASLSPRWFGRGYGAWGMGDHRWKYSGELEYSFTGKRYHSREFPVHSLRLTHLYDMDMLGQRYITNNQDNMFMSWKRMEDIQMTYHRLTKLEYTRESKRGLALFANLWTERQSATRYMTFTDGSGTPHSHYSMSAATLTLRYAPGEKFYQFKTGRLPINLDAPVFTLIHTWGPRSRNVLGNRFALASTELSFFKRWWLSAFGCIDTYLRAGHVWTSSPYPNLLIPNANLSYFIQAESFSCLNPMEFINDSYAQWDFTYWANGAFFNYMPGLKRLKLREAVFIRGVWGHLGRRNRPWLNEGLYAFPAAAHTSMMTAVPYMETGVGLDNLFKILRVDYTWRLTYRHDPYACLGGLRFMIHMSF